MPPFRHLVPLLLLVPIAAVGHVLTPTEQQSYPASLSDDQGPHSCGFGTQILASGPTETSLPTAVQVEILSALTPDGQGFQGLLRLRLVRTVHDKGEVQIIGAPFITRMTLSNLDRSVVASMGPDILRTSDGFFYQYVDPDLTNELMKPSGGNWVRVLTFKDSMATGEDETLSYTIAISPEQFRANQDCMKAVFERAEKMIEAAYAKASQDVRPD